MRVSPVSSTQSNNQSLKARLCGDWTKVFKVCEQAGLSKAAFRNSLEELNQLLPNLTNV